MTPLFASLGLGDFVIIAFVIIVFAGSASLGQQIILRRVERKLDALLQHHGIELPSNLLLSPEVQRLASEANNVTAAIKRHLLENPNLSYAEAESEVKRSAKTNQ